MTPRAAMFVMAALAMGGLPDSSGEVVGAPLRSLSPAEAFALEAARRTEERNRKPDGPSAKTMRRRERLAKQAKPS